MFHLTTRAKLFEAVRECPIGNWATDAFPESRLNRPSRHPPVRIGEDRQDLNPLLLDRATGLSAASGVRHEVWALVEVVGIRGSALGLSGEVSRQWPLRADIGGQWRLIAAATWDNWGDSGQ
jgi:hypothetical protein